ncbi:MAG TPA: GspH/FimT family pseudopilin [Tepidisphaeraceae bacterium]|nr:GspH/FimT family pseudopilin [Tepidisphaeraceae bacterium]
MRSRRSNLAGFTLLELVLVLALIAIMTGIVITRMDVFGRGKRMANSADQVVSLAAWARSQAVARGVSVRLNFDPAQNAYWLTVQNGPAYENAFQPLSGAQTPSQYALISEDWGQSFPVPTGVTFKCNIAPQIDGIYIEFRPNGRCDPGTVQFSDGSGKTIEVGCLSATEDVHVLSDDERQQELALAQPPPLGQTR